ncbi:MAG: short-chain dehydrogenase [bacterium]|nr:MAG: short-chain dehydrogenase [bacterium]
MKLQNKVAVITGGNSGIGLGIAEEFKAEGASGVISGRDTKTLNEAEKKLGPNFIAIQSDVTSMSDLDKLYQKATERFGKIDVLVANAGVARMQPVDQVDEANYDLQFDINVKGVFFTIQKALPHLKDGASIIVMASTAGHKGFQGASTYCATKAAVRSFARTFSAELLPRKIRVNAISPGFIETPAYYKFGLPEDMIPQAKEGFKKLTPLNRAGTANEIGRVAVFLASDDSSFMLGEEMIVDGGMITL